MEAYTLQTIRIEAGSSTVVLGLLDTNDLFSSDIELIISNSSFNRLVGILENDGFDLESKDIAFSYFERNDREISIYDFRNTRQMFHIYPSMFTENRRLLRA